MRKWHGVKARFNCYNMITDYMLSQRLFLKREVKTIYLEDLLGKYLTEIALLFSLQALKPVSVLENLRNIA